MASNTVSHADTGTEAPRGTCTAGSLVWTTVKRQPPWPGIIVTTQMLQDVGFEPGVVAAAEDCEKQVEEAREHACVHAHARSSRRMGENAKDCVVVYYLQDDTVGLVHADDIRPFDASDATFSHATDAGVDADTRRQLANAVEVAKRIQHLRRVRTARGMRSPHASQGAAALEQQEIRLGMLTAPITPAVAWKTPSVTSVQVDSAESRPRAVDMTLGSLVHVKNATGGRDIGIVTSLAALVQAGAANEMVSHARGLLSREHEYAVVSAWEDDPDVALIYVITGVDTGVFAAAPLSSLDVYNPPAIAAELTRRSLSSTARSRNEDIAIDIVRRRTEWYSQRASRSMAGAPFTIRLGLVTWSGGPSIDKPVRALSFDSPRRRHSGFKHALLTRTSENVGEIVWARVSSFPPWPAIVVSPETLALAGVPSDMLREAIEMMTTANEALDAGESPTGVPSVLVFFLAYHRPLDIATVMNIEPFSGEDECAAGAASGHPKNVASAVRDACTLIELRKPAHGPTHVGDTEAPLWQRVGLASWPGGPTVALPSPHEVLARAGLPTSVSTSSSSSPQQHHALTRRRGSNASSASEHEMSDDATESRGPTRAHESDSQVFIYEEPRAGELVWVYWEGHDWPALITTPQLMEEAGVPDHLMRTAERAIALIAPRPEFPDRDVLVFFLGCADCISVVPQSKLRAFANDTVARFKRAIQRREMKCAVRIATVICRERQYPVGSLKGYDEIEARAIDPDGTSEDSDDAPPPDDCVLRLARSCLKPWEAPLPSRRQSRGPRVSLEPTDSQRASAGVNEPQLQSSEPAQQDKVVAAAPVEDSAVAEPRSPVETSPLFQPAVASRAGMLRHGTGGAALANIGAFSPDEVPPRPAALSAPDTSHAAGFESPILPCAAMLRGGTARGGLCEVQPFSPDELIPRHPSAEPAPPAVRPASGAAGSTESPAAGAGAILRLHGGRGGLSTVEPFSPDEVMPQRQVYSPVVPNVPAMLGSNVRTEDAAGSLVQDVDPFSPGDARPVRTRRSAAVGPSPPTQVSSPSLLSSPLVRSRRTRRVQFGAVRGDDIDAPSPGTSYQGEDTLEDDAICDAPEDAAAAEPEWDPAPAAQSSLTDITPLSTASRAGREEEALACSPGLHTLSPRSSGLFVTPATHRSHPATAEAQTQSVPSTASSRAPIITTGTAASTAVPVPQMVSEKAWRALDPMRVTSRTGAETLQSMHASWPGREEVVNECWESWEFACDAPTAVVLTSPTGCGKTQFMRHMIAAAPACGTLVTCSPMERPRAFYERVLQSIADACIDWHWKVAGGREKLSARAMYRRLVAGLCHHRAFLSGMPDSYIASGIACAVALARWASAKHNNLRAITLRVLTHVLSGAVLDDNGMPLSGDQDVAASDGDDEDAMDLDAMSFDSASSDAGAAEIQAPTRMRPGVDDDAAGVAETVSALRHSLHHARCVHRHEFVEHLHALLDLTAFESHSAFGCVPSVDTPASSRVDRRLVRTLGPHACMVSPLVFRLVLDDADALMAVDDSLLAFMMNASHECYQYIAITLITSSPELVLLGLGGSPRAAPRVWLFSPPPRLDMINMLCRWCPEGESSHLFRRFVEAVLHSFNGVVGNNFRELLYIVRTLYPPFIVPVASGKVPRSDFDRLRALAEPSFELMRRGLLRRDADVYNLSQKATTQARSAASEAATGSHESSTAAGNAAAEVQSRSSTAPPAEEDVTIPRQRGVDLELSYFTKMLLLAAFCASMNSPKTDRLFFSRAATGKRRAVESNRKKLAQRKRRAALMGPRVFSLDRLMQIFTGLLHSHEAEVAASRGRSVGGTSSDSGADMPPDGWIFTQLAELERYGHIVRISSREELTLVKYKCCMAVEEAVAVARAVRVDLGKYLEDDAA